MTVLTRSEEIAWAAGLFEGEGCFTMQRTRRTIKSGPVTYVQLVARLHMTDADVVTKFAQIIGFGHLWDYPVYRGSLGTKPAFSWYTAQTDEWFQIWKWFWPHLGQRRRNQAQTLIFEWMLTRMERGLSLHVADLSA